MHHSRVLIIQYENKLKTSWKRIKLKRYHIIIINYLTVYTGTDSLHIIYLILCETGERFLKYSSDCECCKAFTAGEEAKCVDDAGMIKHSTSLHY